MSIPGEDGVHTRVLTVPKRIGNQKVLRATSALTSGRLIVIPIEDFHPTLKTLHQATGYGKERVMLHKV
ncbi:hypothetical protein ACJMK2_017681 [Sinanodonta woodiana]|uniref:Uncharacterized protein n=1 Tax=Sinanodonta woodiana TaxID=1069815 RepID=A0ABD3UB22_SINWO